ncbi:MAG TPA: glycosyltransferase [Anaerolineales bacterium]|nr:glycosyltransferase [Anaerolineales bacterium]
MAKQITILHDWLNQVGGAEDVLQVLQSQYPNAPIYTSMYWRAEMPNYYQTWQIHTTWMDKLPGIYTKHRLYLPLYALAFSGLRLPESDVVLSNKSGFCIFTPKPQGARHICYCLAPSRYVYDPLGYLQREQKYQKFKNILIAWAWLMRSLEARAAQKVDTFIAISKEIQQRVRTYYRRESEIIYPPVDVARFQPVDIEDVADYYLVVSRLISYKAIDLAVRACTELGLPLKVAGKGADLERLKQLAGPTVQFLGYVPDEQLPALMARCRAFLFPGFEDFGITPVQALSAGRPVIAFAAGGALDYVVPGETGVLFAEQSVASLKNAIQAFSPESYSPAKLRQFAMRFDRQLFLDNIRQQVGF